ncbi:MAG: hypothetical protein ACRCSE_05730, partial [Vibrio sp.]
YQALRPLSAPPLKKTRKKPPVHAPLEANAEELGTAQACIWLLVRAKGVLRWRGGVKFGKEPVMVVVSGSGDCTGADAKAQFVTAEQARRIYRDNQLVIVNAQSAERLGDEPCC